MTTIAYCAGIMAGDTQVEWTTEAGGIYSGYECKVFKHELGLIATSGNAGQGWQYIDWFRDGMEGDAQYDDDDEPLDFHALIILNSGGIWKCENGGRMSRQIEPYGAIGSGYSAAMAAMRHGASARRAVETAILYDPATGGEIIEVKL